MRPARPMKLKSGRWGAWVPGEDVQPDMLICIRTLNGKSWYSKIERVYWQGVSGAICKRKDVSMEDDLNLEIPFLDRAKLDNPCLEWFRNWVTIKWRTQLAPLRTLSSMNALETLIGIAGSMSLSHKT